MYNLQHVSGVMLIITEILRQRAPISHIRICREMSPRPQTRHHVCKSEDQFGGAAHNGMRERPGSLSWTYMME